MRLEDLVPPLELCKKIPDGAFADSPLVWEVKDIGETALVMRAGTLPPHLRFGRFKTFVYPAPTLAEIMEALPRMDKIDMVNVWAEGFGWNAQTISNSERAKTAREKADNPTTAALKLWLEVQK